MRFWVLLIFLGLLTSSERSFTANDDSIELSGPPPAEMTMPPEDQ